MSARLAPPAASTTEIAETEAWLYARLTGSAALSAALAGGVFSYIAPPKMAYPLLTFGWQGDRDVQVLEGTTIWVEAVYTVKVYAEGNGEAGLAVPVSAAHSALHGKSGASPSGLATIVSCLRDSSLAMGEVTGGRQYRIGGGLYRIRTQLAGT